MLALLHDQRRSAPDGQATPAVSLPLRIQPARASALGWSPELFALTLLIGGGDYMFRLIFKLFTDMNVFGDLLADHLIKMVLLAFFSMLTFSNLIIMLTTTYLSREVDWQGHRARLGPGTHLTPSRHPLPAAA